MPVKVILAVIGILFVGSVATYSFTSSRELSSAGLTTSSSQTEEGAVVSIDSGAGAALTTGDLGDEIIIQAQQSRENFRRLAEGQVRKLDYSAPAAGGDEEKNQPVTLTLTTGAELKGTITYIKSGTDWILAKAEASDREGSASSIPSLGPDETEMGLAILSTQSSDDSQEYIAETMAGKIKSVSIKSSSVKTQQDGSERESTVLSGEVTGSDGKTGPVKITMEELNGYWYVMEVDKG